MFPRLRERSGQNAGTLCGRRAADAGARPRHDVGAAAALPGRAFARPCAARGAGHLPQHPRHQRGRHQRAAGRAERALCLRDREPRLRAADRQHHRERLLRRAQARIRACRRPISAASRRRGCHDADRQIFARGQDPPSSPAPAPASAARSRSPSRRPARRSPASISTSGRRGNGRG